MKKVLYISDTQMSSEQRWALGGHTELDITWIKCYSLLSENIKNFIQDADIVCLDEGNCSVIARAFELSRSCGRDIIISIYELVDDENDELKFVCWNRLNSVEFNTERFEGC